MYDRKLRFLIYGRQTNEFFPFHFLQIITLTLSEKEMKERKFLFEHAKYDLKIETVQFV